MLSLQWGERVVMTRLKEWWLRQKGTRCRSTYDVDSEVVVMLCALSIEVESSSKMAMAMHRRLSGAQFADCSEIYKLRAWWMCVTEEIQQ